MKFSIFFVLFSLVHFVYAQEVKLKERIDSIIQMKSSKPFNGIVLISEKGKVVYSKLQGYSDLTSKKKLNWNDQFVIGSMSKQFTAVLVLKEVEKGNLKLHTPVRAYLPSINQTWVDTVTIHHLLIHMHGCSFK